MDCNCLKYIFMTLYYFKISKIRISHWTTPRYAPRYLKYCLCHFHCFTAPFEKYCHFGVSIAVVALNGLQMDKKFNIILINPICQAVCLLIENFDWNFRIIEATPKVTKWSLNLVTYGEMLSLALKLCY